MKVENHGSGDRAKNDAIGKRTKHIDIKYHLLQKVLGGGQVAIECCPSSDLTKINSLNPD